MISAPAMRSPTRCWRRTSSRAPPRRRSRCFAGDGWSAFMPIGKSLSAWWRRGDQAKRGPADSARAISKRSARNSAGTVRCRSIIIMPDDGTAPLLIDCNPRLVEPVNAYRAGVDLVGLLLRDLARRDAGAVAGKPRGRADASGDAGAARLRIARRHAAAILSGNACACLPPSGALCRQQRRTHAGAADWISAVPLAMTAAFRLASPKSAIKLARGGFGAHLLDLKSIRMIERRSFAYNCGRPGEGRHHTPAHHRSQACRSLQRARGMVPSLRRATTIFYKGSSSLPWLSRFGVAMSPSS